MKNLILRHIAVFVLFFAEIADAQSTILKFPTSDNVSSFDIIQNDSSNVFRIFGDGGFYISGAYLEGEIPIEGSGVRLMWYPKKAAFRAGRAGDGNSQWDDIRVGDFSVAMGEQTTASGDRSFATGSNTIAGGFASTSMGYLTEASGDYSTALGHLVSTNDNQGSFIIGDHHPGFTLTYSSAPNQMTMRFSGGYRFFTDSDATVGVLLDSNANSWTTISDSTKKENFVYADGEKFLNSLSKLRLGSWNYKSQNPKLYRHYGPMAQEIFYYFGRDELGTIGNDTTLSTADMDGIIMICLQALEKRTAEMKNSSEKIKELENVISKQNAKILSQQNMIKKFRNEVSEFKEIMRNIVKDYSVDKSHFVIKNE